MLSVGEKLDASKGIGPGFDFLRIFLALSVLGAHSVLISEGERNQFAFPPMNLIHWTILPLFFALSGFLITGSALRLRLQDFLLNRAMRIVPALAVDIFISALLIGPIFTRVPLKVYFTQYEFYAYFANITGIIHYVLPGVFEHNPFPSTVNGSLWTVPFEIGCYAIMSLFIVTGLLKRPALFAATCCGIIGFVLITYAPWFHALDVLPKRVDTLLSHFFEERGNLLYCYFACGCLFYVFRYRVPFSVYGFCVCLAIYACGAAEVFGTGLAGKVFLMPLIVYCMIFVGLSRIPKLPLYHRGDYSYGIYLYGYPLQQALVASFPQMTSPVLHFAITLPLVTLVAMFSWHCVEKPILRLRRKFSFTARKGDSVQEETMPRSVEAAKA